MASPAPDRRHLEAPSPPRPPSRRPASPAEALRRGRGIGLAARRPGVPGALAIFERAPATGWEGYAGPVVIFVHGSLDRSASFRRTALRLPGLAVVTYDRRGYQGSRTAGVAPDLAGHAEDLVAIATAYRTIGPVTVVGHSLGATVTLGAAVAAPSVFASIGLYEPSMPWLGFHRPSPPDRSANDGEAPLAAGKADAVGGGAEHPGSPVEQFFRRMVGQGAWQRLPASGRASRLADEAALVADLRSIRGAVPFDATALVVPSLVASGGPSSFPHHRQTVEWLVGHLASAERAEIPDAGHGAHLSHPDAFATFVRRAVALATAPGTRLEEQTS